jgi:hypothetical protein
MARYLVETNYTDDVGRRGITPAAPRTPEIAVVAAFVTIEPTARCAWILLSPSEQHIRHWASDAGLTVLRCTPIVILGDAIGTRSARPSY